MAPLMHMLGALLLVGCPWLQAFGIAGLDSFSNPAVLGASALKEFTDGVVDTGKLVSTPVGQVAVGALSKACEPVKKLIGIDYNAYKKGEEPNVENLKIAMKTLKGLKEYNISTAHRNIRLSSDFDVNKHIVLYIHGFTDNPNGTSFSIISNAFSTKKNYNILALDGSSLIKWLYLRSTTYVRFMGEKLGLLLAEMVQAGVPRERIHLIGHSLGSHVAGFTGKMFRNLTGERLVRISSLDPAGPCFIDLEKDLRLSKEDADFVDVTHTNGGVFGLKDPVGHVDFYPNAGETQPGCTLPTCDHGRAYDFYAESVINPTSLLARKCADWKTFIINKCGDQLISPMGFNVDPKARGNYYLRTAGESPFGLGNKGLEGPDGSFDIVKNIAGVAGSKIADAIV